MIRKYVLRLLIDSFIQFEPESSFQLSFFLSLPDILKTATTFLTFLDNSKRGAKTHEVKVNNNNNIWLFMKIAFLSSYKDEDDMAKNKFLHSFTLLARKTMVPFILRRRRQTTDHLGGAKDNVCWQHKTTGCHRLWWGGEIHICLILFLSFFSQILWLARFLYL